MKKILVVAYSQSGQLDQIVRNVLIELKKDDKIFLMVPESARFSYSFMLLTVV